MKQFTEDIIDKPNFVESLEQLFHTSAPIKERFEHNSERHESEYDSGDFGRPKKRSETKFLKKMAGYK